MLWVTRDVVAHLRCGVLHEMCWLTGDVMGNRRCFGSLEMWGNAHNWACFGSLEMRGNRVTG